MRFFLQLNRRIWIQLIILCCFWSSSGWCYIRNKSHGRFFNRHHEPRSVVRDGGVNITINNREVEGFSNPLNTFLFTSSNNQNNNGLHLRPQNSQDASLEEEDKKWSPQSVVGLSSTKRLSQKIQTPFKGIERNQVQIPFRLLRYANFSQEYHGSVNKTHELVYVYQYEESWNEVRKINKLHIFCLFILMFFFVILRWALFLFCLLKKDKKKRKEKKRKESTFFSIIFKHKKPKTNTILFIHP